MTLLLLLLILIIIYYYTFSENFNNTEKYTAVIIEPRKHNALEFVLTNFTENLDERWNFIIFHGTLNKSFVDDIINTKLQNHKNRFKLIDLNVDNLTINDYNKILYSKEFYDNIPTEMFLIFQCDTIICKQNKDNIYKFMDYDYVGAPWDWMNGEVGNGGLSLRRKSKMIEILDKCKKSDNLHNEQNEDILFAFGCDDVKPKKPNTENASLFSIENIYNSKPFGHHKSWHYFKDDYNRFFNECTDYEKIVQLNSK